MITPEQAYNNSLQHAVNKKMDVFNNLDKIEQAFNDSVEKNSKSGYMFTSVDDIQHHLFNSYKPSANWSWHDYCNEFERLATKLGYKYIRTHEVTPHKSGYDRISWDLSK